MDAEGWAHTGDVLRLARLSFEELLEVVETNEKRRFEIDDDRIRAVQGHSGGAPVSPDALEASWRVVMADEPVFHGTSAAAARAILFGDGDGIVPGQRSHVHLAAAPDAKVGKRARVELLLVVSPARLRASGVTLFEAPNGVLLARTVPRECILDVRPAGARFEGVAEELRAELRRRGLSPQLERQPERLARGGVEEHRRSGEDERAEHGEIRLLHAREGEPGAFGLPLHDGLGERRVWAQQIDQAARRRARLGVGAPGRGGLSRA